jgi:hypothetical protein
MGVAPKLPTAAMPGVVAMPTPPGVDIEGEDRLERAGVPGPGVRRFSGL